MTTDPIWLVVLGIGSLIGILALLSVPVGWGVGRAIEPLIDVLKGIRQDAQQRHQEAKQTEQENTRSARRATLAVRTLAIDLENSLVTISATGEFNKLVSALATEKSLHGAEAPLNYSMRVHVSISSEESAQREQMDKISEIIARFPQLIRVSTKDITV